VWQNFFKDEWFAGKELVKRALITGITGDQSYLATWAGIIIIDRQIISLQE
jgi:hypothetical protein